VFFSLLSLFVPVPCSSASSPCLYLFRVLWPTQPACTCSVFFSLLSLFVPVPCSLASSPCLYLFRVLWPTQPACICSVFFSLLTLPVPVPCSLAYSACWYDSLLSLLVPDCNEGKFCKSVRNIESRLSLLGPVVLLPVMCHLTTVYTAYQNFAGAKVSHDTFNNLG
jgi:hypothetical protein